MAVGMWTPLDMANFALVRFPAHLQLAGLQVAQAMNRTTGGVTLSFRTLGGGGIVLRTLVV